MALMLAKTFAALRAAGVGEQQAEDAAAEIAGYDNRLATIDTRVAVLTWMVGAHIAVTLAIAAPAIWLLLRVAAKVGAL